MRRSEWVLGDSIGGAPSTPRAGWVGEPSNQVSNGREPERRPERAHGDQNRHDGTVSTKIDLADLPTEITSRGPAAFLTTMGEERPHIVSVAVADDGNRVLHVPAGRTTARNVADRPGVTLLWPFDTGHPGFSLLVDGTGTMTEDGDRLAIEVTGAILHRAGGRGPGC